MNSTTNTITTFLKSSNCFWNVSVLSDFFEFMDDLVQSGGDEVYERSFKIFEKKINQAVNEFFYAMNGIQLVMNCRAKCDNDSNFGGNICAKFMSDVMDVCSEYIKNSQFLSGKSEGELGCVIRGIKTKAEAGRTFAVKFEKDAKNLYLSEGTDNTMQIFEGAGYFDSERPIKSISDIKNFKKNIMINKG